MLKKLRSTLSMLEIREPVLEHRSRCLQRTFSNDSGSTQVCRVFLGRHLCDWRPANPCHRDITDHYTDADAHGNDGIFRNTVLLITAD